MPAHSAVFAYLEDTYLPCCWCCAGLWLKLALGTHWISCGVMRNSENWQLAEITPELLCQGLSAGTAAWQAALLWWRRAAGLEQGPGALAAVPGRMHMILGWSPWFWDGLLWWKWGWGCTGSAGSVLKSAASWWASEEAAYWLLQQKKKRGNFVSMLI